MKDFIIVYADQMDDKVNLPKGDKVAYIILGRPHDEKKGRYLGDYKENFKRAISTMEARKRSIIRNPRPSLLNNDTLGKYDEKGLRDFIEAMKDDDTLWFFGDDERRVPIDMEGTAMKTILERGKKRASETK